MTTPNRSTRREWLVRTGGAAALALTARWRPLLAATGRWFKIGCCEFCLGKPDPSLLAVAKRIGLDGLQIDLGGDPDEHLLRPEVQRAYLDAARDTGMEIASVSAGVMNRVPVKSDPRAVRWLEQSIGACANLGVQVMMPAFFPPNGDLDMSNTREIDTVVAALKVAAAEAEKAGVLIGLENYLSAEDNMKIIDRVGSPAVRVYYDVGNSTDKGRDIYREIRLLGKLICEFHAKDGPHMLGQGRVDFARVREAIDDIGYSGWFQIEAARPSGVEQDYAAHYRYLRTIFPERG